MNLYQFGIHIQNRGLKNMLSTTDCTCKEGTCFPFIGTFTPGGQKDFSTSKNLTFIYDGFANLRFCGFFQLA